jgi:hypothetical protein
VEIEEGDTEEVVGIDDEVLEGAQGLSEEQFSDDSGEQSYDLDDIQLDRGVITTPYDAPVRTLVAEIADKDLIVNPKFQRQNVWGRDRQSKLIESLLLNIPIPVLYFAEDEDGTRVVVDGQQRLRAIEEFYAGRYALKKLEVLSSLNGKRWTDLTPKQSRTVLSRTLRCVVISSSSPPTLRFEMFERLNTGGMPLNDQELRNCVFGGSLNDLLHTLVRTKPWLFAVRKTYPELRMRHEELALRFFALRSVIQNYRPPLKQVLNEYMRRNRNPEQEALDELSASFERALRNCIVVFGNQSFRRIAQAKPGVERWDTNVNRAVFDVQMLSFADLSQEIVNTKREQLRDTFKLHCLADEEFQDAVSLATADRKKFYTRMRIWLTALSAEGVVSPLAELIPRI